MSLRIRAGVVDVCLIPEVEFSLEKLTEYVQCLLARKGHTVRPLCQIWQPQLAATSPCMSMAGLDPALSS